MLLAVEGNDFDFQGDIEDIVLSQIGGNAKGKEEDFLTQRDG